MSILRGQGWFLKIIMLLLVMWFFFPSGVYATPAQADSSTASTHSDDNAPEDSDSITMKDPYEPFNRAMYHFNDALDRAVLKPIASLYKAVVPKPIAKGIGNFFSNINNLPTIANDLLQANFYQATSDAWRLVINSTVGVLGFFDVAQRLGLEPNTEDFGLTLAQWGYKDSNYLVLPFFGPSTIRDGIGLPVDYYVFSIYPHIHPASTRYAIYGLGVISRRADLLQFQSVFEEASLDKYVFLRNAYLQRRNYLIERNKELGDPYLDKNNHLESAQSEKPETVTSVPHSATAPHSATPPSE